MVIQRFLAFSRDVQPFHMYIEVVAEGYAVGEDFELTIVLEGDVVGEDFAGTMQMYVVGASFEADTVIKDDRAYVRLARGEWMEADEYRQTQPMNPFALIEASDITYGGRIMRSGQRLHLLETDVLASAFDASALEGIRRAQVESSEMIVFVNDDGVPVEAELYFEITGRAERKPVHISYAVLYVISDVGKPVTIEAPLP